MDKELETLQKSNGYVFSKKDLPHQVFSTDFDRYIFIEDVHFFAVELIKQIKQAENILGGESIYLHTIEPYLPRDIGYTDFYLSVIPPCFELSCLKSYSYKDIFQAEILPGQNYDRALRTIHILFGDSGQWGYYNSRDEEIGIIGIKQDIFEQFKQNVPYAFDNCFTNFDEMLLFVKHLSREENFPFIQEQMTKNYAGKDF